MLKSQLDISRKIRSLENQLNSYCISVLDLSITDRSIKSVDSYETVFMELIKLTKKDQEQLRESFISKINNEMKILAVIDNTLCKDDFDATIIDNVLINDAKQQIVVVNNIIDECLKSKFIKQTMMIQYYFSSLKLLSDFTAIKASIKTIENIWKKFNQDESDFVIKFIKAKKKSFYVPQQKVILDLIDKILVDLLSEHIDKVKAELDTGSPEFEIRLKIMTELDINMRLFQLFELIFKHEVDEAAHVVKVINTILNKNKKNDTTQLSDNEIESRILKIIEEYDQPSKINFKEARKIDLNKIEIQFSSDEEQAVNKNGNNKCLVDGWNNTHNTKIIKDNDTGTIGENG